VICPTAKAVYFFGWDWTGSIRLIWFNKLALARTVSQLARTARKIELNAPSRRCDLVKASYSGCPSWLAIADTLFCMSSGDRSPALFTNRYVSELCNAPEETKWGSHDRQTSN
jgi:hypothetical protein